MARNDNKDNGMSMREVIDTLNKTSAAELEAMKEMVEANENRERYLDDQKEMFEKHSAMVAAAEQEKYDQAGMLEKVGLTLKGMFDFQKMRAQKEDRAGSVGGPKQGELQFEKVDFGGIKKLPGIGLILDIIGDITDVFTKTLLPIFKNLLKGLMWLASKLVFLAVIGGIIEGLVTAFKKGEEEY